MKRYILAITLLLAAAVRPAGAQVHGVLCDASVVPVNTHLGGTYLQLDPSSATLSGQLRMSLYQNFDFGFQGGLSRIGQGNNAQQTSVRLGGDFRGQVAKESSSFPLNVSLGAAIEVENADGFNILSVGPQIALSRNLDSAGKWIGYGGASLLLSRYESGGSKDNDTSFPLRAGAEFRPTPDFRLIGEMQVAVSDAIRDDVSFTFGALFPF